MARRGLTREQVLAAAVAIVDAEGLEALSMRRLGQALGVEAMSLYRHVRDKEDLLDGVHGAIVAEMRPVPRSGTWSARVTALAHAFRDVLRAHPRALALFVTRPAVAPTSLAYFDQALGVLEEAGLSPADRLRCVHTLLSYVVGSAMWQFGDTGDERAPRVDYGALSPAALPHLARAAPALEGWDLEAEFSFGLDAFVRGLAGLKRRQATRR